MAKVRNCVWVSPSSILTIAHNLFRQFLNVTFNKIVCQLVLFLFYETPPPDLLSSLLLVLLAGYFGFQVSARQLSAESVRGARFQAPDQLWFAGQQAAAAGRWVDRSSWSTTEEFNQVFRTGTRATSGQALLLSLLAKPSKYRNIPKIPLPTWPLTRALPLSAAAAFLAGQSIE